MRIILLIIGLTLLNGCLSTSINRHETIQPLELFFSPEQTTLTTKQQQALQQFFYHLFLSSIGSFDWACKFIEPFSSSITRSKKELQQSSNCLNKSKFHYILLLCHNKPPIP